jgi:hypothetical protein
MQTFAGEAGRRKGGGEQGGLLYSTVDIRQILADQVRICFRGCGADAAAGIRKRQFVYAFAASFSPTRCPGGAMAVARLERALQTAAP